MKYSTTLALALLASGCARQLDPTAATTTLTSATTGERATSAATTDEERAAFRLADAICERAVTCARIGAHRDALYRSEEACMQEQNVRASAFVRRWSCVPPLASPGLRECLAAIRDESCETRIERADQVRECSDLSVCKPRFDG